MKFETWAEGSGGHVVINNVSFENTPYNVAVAVMYLMYRKGKAESDIFCYLEYEDRILEITQYIRDGDMKSRCFIPIYDIMNSLGYMESVERNTVSVAVNDMIDSLGIDMR